MDSKQDGTTDKESGAKPIEGLDQGGKAEAQVGLQDLTRSFMWL